MAFGPFERLVALRYLRARRREGFVSLIAGFSLLGIGLGVATLIIVLAVMNGFRHELLDRILGLNGHVGVYRHAGPLTDYDGMAARLAAVPGVVAVTPVAEGQVMAAARGGGALGAMLRGLRAEDLAQRPLVAGSIEGDLAAFRGDDAVIIGRRMADKLGLAVGDRLTLISPRGSATAFGMVPRIKAYTVVATFAAGMAEYDSSFVFMPLAAAQTYLRLPGAVSHLEIILDDPDRLAAIVPALLRVGGDDIQLYDWQRANAGFFKAIEVERNVMFLILTLIILVAAFNIISSLIMLVKDKGRDIAILRTMGATRATVMRIFLLSGTSIGLVGTVAGVLLGLVFASNIELIRQWLQALTGVELFSADIYFLTELPARIDPVEVTGVAAMALALSFAATLYPAWRAARTDPAEALRYE